MKPKYKVGDLLIYRGYYEGGTSGVFIVDRIEMDEFDRYIYYHDVSETCKTFIYEDDVIGVIDYDSEKYKRYQLYLELKKEFG